MPQFRSYVSLFWQWKLHNHCMSLLSIVFCSHRLSFTLSIRYSFWMLPCFVFVFMFFSPQHYSHSLLLTLSLPLRQTNHSYLTWNASSMQVHWHGNGATDTIFQTNVPGADHLNQFCLTSFGQQLDCNRCLFPYKSWNSHLKQRYLIWLFVSVLICIISASILMTVPLINVFIF